MNLKPNRKFKPNFEDARGRGTRGDNNSFKLYSGRAQLQIQTQRSTSTFNHTRGEPNFRFRLNARLHLFKQLEAMTNLLSSSVIKIIHGANPTPPSDSMLDIIFSTISNHIIKPLEIEVLEAITTHSSYTRGEPYLFN
ncbi:hypothetical protein GIB67_013741, partial [Kingdonia uniflora]